MFLPAKHISFAESLFGFSSLILENLTTPMTVDQLWALYEKSAESYPAYQSFDNMVLALDALFAFGAINVNNYGEIMKVKIEYASCV